jgi:hypothetical protein
LSDGAIGIFEDQALGLAVHVPAERGIGALHFGQVNGKNLGWHFFSRHFDQHGSSIGSLTGSDCLSATVI